MSEATNEVVISNLYSHPIVLISMVSDFCSTFKAELVAIKPQVAFVYNQLNNGVGTPKR